MFTGRRFRAELTGEQVEYAERIADVCRAVWNTGLEHRRAYRQRRVPMNYRQQAAELAEAKTEHIWLAEAPAHCLQQLLMDLDKACRQHGTFRVRWRSSRRWRPTLRRDGNHWYLSFLVDDGYETPASHPVPGTAVGVDRGVAVAIATSNGDLADRQFLTSGEQRRALALQRRLSRSAKPSRNRTKVRGALRTLRSRERHRRQDFCARIAHRLVTNNELVVIEALKTKQMTRSARGALKAPGINVRAKSGLNRAILSKGWNQFALALSSAARYSGTRIITVPAQYTSQRCSACGHVDPKSRESQAVFRCTHCARPAEHADVNAARNILTAGLAVTACADASPLSDRVASTKQEPAGNREELLLQPGSAA